MNYAQIRSDLAKAVSTCAAANFPSKILAFDNRDQEKAANLATTDLWFKVEVVFGASEQLTFAETPHIRTLGMLVVSAKSPKGSGSASILAALDLFALYLQRRKFGSTKLLVPKIAQGPQSDPWYIQQLILPFYSDTVVT